MVTLPNTFCSPLEMSSRLGSDAGWGIQMGKFVLYTIAFLGAFAGRPAEAADLPLKAPMAAPVGFSWTGLYFGAHVGGGWKSEDWFYPSTLLNSVSQAPVGAPFNVPAGAHDAASGLIGGQIGYNYQIGHWVLGTEAAASWTNLKGSHADPRFPNIESSHADFVGTLGARVGYAWDRFLLFGKAGGAWAHERYYANAASTFTVGDPGPYPLSTILAGSLEDQAKLNRFGYMVGLGGEYAFSPNWSVTAEYEYLSFGRQRVTLSPAEAGLAPFDEDIRQQLQLLKLGINYKLGAPAPVLSAYAQANRPDAGPRFYGGAEYLLWSVKGAPLSVPLVSTGPVSNKEGFLVNSSTTILYGAPFAPATGGNDTQNFPLFSGGRLTLGYWLDDSHRMAIEGRAFLLQTHSAGFDASTSSTTGLPGLRIPLYNNVRYNPGAACDPTNPITCSIGKTEDGSPISVPGGLYGSVSVTNKLQLWGADGTAVIPFAPYGTWELATLLGARYLNLTENFNLTGNLIGIASSPLYAGQSGTATDQFDTRNQFFGGVVGLRARTFWHAFSLEMSGRLGIGVSHEALSVAGFYRDSGSPFANSSGPYGIFAMPANSGTFSRNEFALVPEAQVKVGYNITPSTRIFAGYDFLYDSNVIRPGDQINRNVPKGQTFQQDATVNSTTSPASLFKSTDFYAHGLNVGFEATF